MVCRACCCGTTAKHPRTDHDAQVETLEAAVADDPGVRLQVVDCLDECDRSNVVVLRRPALPARQRDTWLGGLLSEGATSALAEWLRAGGRDELPSRVRGHVFRRVPPRKR